MDAAQITITTTDVAAGFGLSFFYSSAVDVEIMAALAVLETAAVAADVAAVVVTTTAVNGLLFFLFSSAAAETMVPAANFFMGIVFYGAFLHSQYVFCY